MVCSTNALELLSYNGWLTLQGKKSILTHYFHPDTTHTQKLKVIMIVMEILHAHRKPFYLAAYYIYPSSQPLSFILIYVITVAMDYAHLHRQHWNLMQSLHPPDAAFGLYLTGTD